MSGHGPVERGERLKVIVRVDDGEKNRSETTSTMGFVRRREDRKGRGAVPLASIRNPDTTYRPATARPITDWESTPDPSMVADRRPERTRRGIGRRRMSRPSVRHARRWAGRPLVML